MAIKQRDMTQRDFNEACQRYGFVDQEDGYFSIDKDQKVRVYILIGGDKRREQLSYLIKSLKEYEKRISKNGDES